MSLTVKPRLFFFRLKALNSLKFSDGSLLLRFFFLGGGDFFSWGGGGGGRWGAGGRLVSKETAVLRQWGVETNVWFTNSADN